jgi:hypothetical protein
MTDTLLALGLGADSLLVANLVALAIVTAIRALRAERR